MKTKDIQCILILEENDLDVLFDIMNEHNIKVAKPSDFEYLFTNQFIYNLTRELLKDGFNDLKDVTEYMEEKDILILLSDSYINLFEKTNIFYINIQKILV